MEVLGFTHAHESRPVLVALIVAAAVCLCMGVAARIVNGDIPFPACGFRAVSGVPCPACGATSSLSLMADGQLSAAIANNPLVSLTAIAAFLAVPTVWLGVQSNQIDFARTWLRRKFFKWALAALLIANWAYLIRVG